MCRRDWCSLSRVFQKTPTPPHPYAKQPRGLCKAHADHDATRGIDSAMAGNLGQLDTKLCPHGQSKPIQTAHVGRNGPKHDQKDCRVVMQVCPQLPRDGFGDFYRHRLRPDRWGMMARVRGGRSAPYGDIVMMLEVTTLVVTVGPDAEQAGMPEPARCSVVVGVC